MIIFFSCILYISLIGYSLAMMTRRARGAAPMTAVTQHPPPASLPARADDDPVQWLPARGEWTALDERQLTRLLRDSAS